MMYEEVLKQHEHFGLRYTGKPRHLDETEKAFYVGALIEEVAEYNLAETLEDEYDGLLDILVFALGALLRQGLSPEGIKEVVRANMSKELGPIIGKREEFQLDLFKPEGWQAPNLKSFL